MVNSILNDYGCVASFCRSAMKGGGAGIWCRPGIKCEPLDCTEFSEEGVCELAAVSITVGEGTKLLLVSAYRPPSHQHDRFCDLVAECLNKNAHRHSTSVVMGDLNIDLSGESFPAQKLVSIMSSFGLRNIVRSYTREVLGSRSLIDHVFTDSINVNCSVVSSSLSDHYAQVATIYFSLAQSESTARYQVRRTFSDSNVQLFNYLIAKES